MANTTKKVFTVKKLYKNLNKHNEKLYAFKLNIHFCTFYEFKIHGKHL